MHVKKGETVIVIAGNDKGKVGEISDVYRDAGRLTVKGVNLRWKHKRPSQQNPKGERVQQECSIHHSNVMLYDAELKKGVRKRKAESKR
ncbi:MAG: 50S ribosomal protein L24 [Planctomycetes bacterium]|nr:50S ribosomal protein L24 [Planctomycetota bacterium]